MSALASMFAIEYGESQFEFQPNWSLHEQMGVIKNGCGDELFAHFIPAGCFIKGFAHESEMTPYKKNPPQLWPGLLDSVPSAFQRSLEEPAFDIPATTFVIWRLTDDNAWSTGDVEYSPDEYGDGSSDLLQPLTYTSLEFSEWLSAYYEVTVNSSIVESVFNHQPLTDAEMLALNPSQSLRVLRDAIRQTGYPIA